MLHSMLYTACFTQHPIYCMLHSMLYTACFTQHPIYCMLHPSGLIVKNVASAVGILIWISQWGQNLHCVSRHHGGPIETPLMEPLGHHCTMVPNRGLPIGPHYCERCKPLERLRMKFPVQFIIFYAGKSTVKTSNISVAFFVQKKLNLSTEIYFLNLVKLNQTLIVTALL